MNILNQHIVNNHKGQFEVSLELSKLNCCQFERFRELPKQNYCQFERSREQANRSAVHISTTLDVTKLTTLDVTKSTTLDVTKSTPLYTTKNRTLLQIVFILFVLLVSSSHLKAQQPGQDLYMIARPLQDSIILRWAPANYEAWNLGNQHGYTVMRYTIVRDSLVLENPDVKELTTQAYKPLELYDWEPLVKADKYAAIAAQAIYGETFEIEASGGINPENVTKLAQEQRQRFSFALYAADMSPAVAKASALWLTDKTAAKNEKYLYRVFINIPEGEEASIDTGFVFTGIPEYMPLPKPIEISTEVEEKQVRIGWNVFAQNNIYMSWEIERSDNKGRDFELITKEPIVTLSSDENPAEYAYRMDSLAVFNKEYQYRVRGISSFGERGPWSDAVKATALELIKGAPVISGHQEVDGKVLIRWEFPTEDQGRTESFKILRANNASTGFASVAEGIKVSEREYTDEQPLPTAYYKVVSVGENNEKTSPVYLVQISDHIPPAPPTGLTGVADSLGKIHLSWQANTEADIYGYMLFKSASGKDEYTQVTNRPVTGTEFTDSVQKNDLNAGVYYRLMAVDHRYNQSDFSEIVFVTKVDAIPPSLPVLTVCKNADGGIELTWFNSSSTDVAKHEVHRLLDGDSAWVKLGEVVNKKYTEQSTYTDVKASSAKVGRYRIVAVDKAGNISHSAPSIDIKALKTVTTGKVRKVRSTVDHENGRITLTWQAPEAPVKLYKIYRKTKDQRYAVYETINGETAKFEDYGMKAGNFYAYRIKVVFMDGTVSGFSDEVKIEF